MISWASASENILDKKILKSQEIGQCLAGSSLLGRHAGGVGQLASPLQVADGEMTGQSAADEHLASSETERIPLKYNGNM